MTDLSPYRIRSTRQEIQAPARQIDWAGETIFLLAHRELGSWQRWREIADMNAMDALDPLIDLSDDTPRPATLGTQGEILETGLDVPIDLSEDTGITATVHAISGQVWGTGNLRITEHLDELDKPYFMIAFAIHGEAHGEAQRLDYADMEDPFGEPVTRKFYLDTLDARAIIELELDHDVLLMCFFAQEEGLDFTLSPAAGRTLTIPSQD